MKICLVHSHRPTREILVKALTYKLHVPATGFACIEEVFESPMDYDVFILYSEFGRKMDRVDGMRWIKAMKPDALVISMIHTRYFDRKHAPPGTDAVVFEAGSDIHKLVEFIGERMMNKTVPPVPGNDT
jgi:hypothetical protein